MLDASKRKAIQENNSMQSRPALQPLATGIAHPELSASATSRRSTLLPLGAMWLVLRRTARRHARGAVRSPHARRPPGP